MTITKKMKKLIYLIAAISIATIACVVMVVASVKTSKYGKDDFSQSLTIKSIEINQEKSDGELRILCHDVVIDGEIRNNSKDDYLIINLEIVFAGVNSSTGEYMEYVHVKELRDFNSGANYDIINEKLTLVSINGYIPESIREVRLVVNNNAKVVPFEEISEANLVLFAMSLGLLFVAGFLFAKWNILNKPVIKVVTPAVNNNEVQNENLIDGE